MPILLWDPSGLAKRYAPEQGSDAVDALFDLVPSRSMVIAITGYAETHSILLRKRNQGIIDQHAYVIASSALQDEVIDNPDFGILDVTSENVLRSIELMRRHNINSSDAAMLAAFLDYAVVKRKLVFWSLRISA